MALSAIVVSYQRRDLLAACLASLERALRAYDDSSEVLVVDNAPGDGAAELVADRFPQVRLIGMPRNVGFAGAVNAGISQAGGDWILVLNNDTELAEDAIAELVRIGEDSPGVGAVSPQIRFAGPHEAINSAGIEIDALGVATDRLLGQAPSASEEDPTEVFGASGGAALYRRAMLDDVGGMDESFFLYLEDVDLAWRARMRGWRSLYAPGAVVYHHHSATTRHGSKLKHFHSGRNRMRLLAKNATRQQLMRKLVPIVAYDLAYVAFAGATDRTLAPLSGRLAGLRDWRAYRRAGAEGRVAIDLPRSHGVRGALGRRAAWRDGSSSFASRA
jgi:GT2 family glycosyltransferase